MVLQQVMQGGSPLAAVGADDHGASSGGIQQGGLGQLGAALVVPKDRPGLGWGISHQQRQIGSCFGLLKPFQGGIAQVGIEQHHLRAAGHQLLQALDEQPPLVSAGGGSEQGV